MDSILKDMKTQIEDPAAGGMPRADPPIIEDRTHELMGELIGLLEARGGVDEVIAGYIKMMRSARLLERGGFAESPGRAVAAAAAEIVHQFQRADFTPEQIEGLAAWFRAKTAMIKAVAGDE